MSKLKTYIEYGKVKFTIDNQTFTVYTSEDKESLKWFKEMLDKAFAKLEVKK